MSCLLACWNRIKHLYYAAENFGDPARIFTTPSWSRIILGGVLNLTGYIGLFFHEEIIIWYQMTFNGVKLEIWQPGKYLLFRIVLTVLAAMGIEACIAAGIRYHKQNKLTRGAQRGRSD